MGVIEISPIDRIDKAIGAIREELIRASSRFHPMVSAHEGAAVIREEFDEFWDEVKRNDTEKAREEVTQLGAMAARFLMDIE